MSETLSEQDGHSEMMVDLFTKNFWLAIGTWVALYGLDYGLTLVGAKLYRSRGSKHYSFSEGYELNPVFKEDIARLRVFSFRFFLLLIFSSGLLAILYSANFPPAFVLAWGALVGVQLSILHRHIRNLALFYPAHDSGGISGRIEIKHWLSLRLAGVESLYFCGLFLFLYLLTGSLFMLGAAAGCFSLGLRAVLDSRKNRRLATKSETKS